MGKNNSAAKNRYNEATYARYTIRIRKDSALYDDIEYFMSKKYTGLNYLAEKLLKEYFFHSDNDPENI